jgi:hypothetical protein
LATYYVLLGAKEKGDASDGKFWYQPFASIKRASNIVRAGDTVYVGPGVYVDDPLMPTSGGEEKFLPLDSRTGFPPEPTLDAFYINWIGDPMGEHLRVAPGVVQVPWYENHPGQNAGWIVVWFIDFYTCRPWYVHPVQGYYTGGGHSALLIENGQFGTGIDTGDPWKGQKGQFAPTFFISCKFAHGIRMICPKGAAEGPFSICAGFRSCLIGYNFYGGSLGAELSMSSIFFVNQRYLSMTKVHNAGKLLIYGCTIKAAPSLDTALVQCYNLNPDCVYRDDPWMPIFDIPNYCGKIAVVNSILDISTSQFFPDFYGRIQKGTPIGACYPDTGFLLNGSHNIYRYREHLGSRGAFSWGYQRLSDWQEASKEYDGDLNLRVFSATDQVSFTFFGSFIRNTPQGIKMGRNEFHTVTNPTVLTAGVWHHIAVVFDRGDVMDTGIDGHLSLIVDGTASTVTAPNASYYSFPFRPLFIGGAPAPFDQSIRGFIDEVRIWNKALTTAEIIANASVDLDMNSEPELHRYYKFDDGEGTIAFNENHTTNYGTINGATWDTDVPFGSGYSLKFGQNSSVSLRPWTELTCPIDWDIWRGSIAGSFTIEMWVKFLQLPSEIGCDASLFNRGVTSQESDSFELASSEPLFDIDGVHILEESRAIDAGLSGEEGLLYSGEFDFEYDPRPYSASEPFLCDIGADEWWPSNEPNFYDPYGFASKVFGFTVDGFYPSKYLVGFEIEEDETVEGVEVCPGIKAPAGGWRDRMRILISFNPSKPGKWLEVYNSLNPAAIFDLRGVEQKIPGSFRGPHFRVCFEIYPAAEHLLKFDLGMDQEDAMTTEITADTLRLGKNRTLLVPGCEVIAYNQMFKERVGSAIVGADGNFSIPVWPGTYYVRFQGPNVNIQDQPKWVTAGFSDWYAPFGQTHCSLPIQFDWSEFENDFQGTEWASWYMNEQFIDEQKRVSTELPDHWPAELYNKKAFVRCGRLVKGASWVTNFEIYTDPPLNLEGWQNLRIWDSMNLFIPWSF